MARRHETAKPLKAELRAPIGRYGCNRTHAKYSAASEDRGCLAFAVAQVRNACERLDVGEHLPSRWHRIVVVYAVV